MNELIRIDPGPHVPMRPSVPARRLTPRALRLALSFIETNLGERFTLDALAASVGISRFHFARLFRSTMGHSPMEYLMRLRVERSTSLLARGDASICEIAATLGFCDQSHFTRTFRRMTGTSPRDFARSLVRAQCRDQRASRDA